jgi:hypothetical protein
MESIEEEKSELAMDIAAAVVEKLDIDRKLDERMRELMLRGDRIFRDIQLRQEQSTEALCKSVGMCLEGQRSFHEEHQRLLNAVRELATMVMPYTNFSAQAMEAQERATAIVQETEVLKKQMEEHRVASAQAMAAAIAPAMPSSPNSHMPASPLSATSPIVHQGASTTFSITLRKADDVSLGLSVNADEQENKAALIVEAVLPGGAVESWNRQCFGDGSGERVVVAGDRILRVNDIEQDVQKMLEECSKKRLVKLKIGRGAPAANSWAGSPVPMSGLSPQQASIEVSDQSPSMLRRKAPEFVPSGVDAPPLQQTQVLAAPPGLFFPTHEDQVITKKLATGSLGNHSSRQQSVDGDDDGSDKEN